ncbi:YgiQ family radical SAM protein [Chakrabartyella piscis]|uniref:YgiQ family radical SAM protein n=1 Tax=Chakrabartyella piscis TaxID=2918914 RepID=UPI0029583FCA|nr:YgiQ family radical SAM protein [Chakrabartyella piscis]
MIKDFLPINKEDMKKRGWDEVDFVYVSGDAYVDHPSFGHAIITRALEAAGYTVGLICQPDWTDSNSITILGKPKLGFLVSSGNMDSMVNHYSVSKKRRQTDAYTPGGEIGKRPDYATIVYSNLIRQVYKDSPIILGGIEASLRRLAHYDYWSNRLKRSILMDSGADIVSFGMGEHSIIELADALKSGIAVKDITFVDGTAYKTKDLDSVYDYTMLQSFTQMKADKLEYAKSFNIQNNNTDPFTGKRLVESYGSVHVVQNPPSKPLTQSEMDRTYSYPYMRTYHPSYEAAGGIPAIEEVKYSLISNRGCFGACSFCALTFHQGRIIQARSHESLVNEARKFIDDPRFKGYIHDVGGPTANFRKPACKKQLTHGACKDKQCLFPEPCKNLEADHKDYIKLLHKLRELPNVKKVFIRSGIRFDYLLADKDDTFFNELCEHHVSGQLKVAPEHISDAVLSMMGKPENSVYEKFLTKFKRINERLGKKQFVVPYLMSSHPGSTLKEAVELAEYLRNIGYMPEQVQDFYPTPSTISTCMYYTGVDPRTMKPVYVPVNPHEKAMQRALIQYRNPKNYGLVMEALQKAHRMDLVGFDQNCLIRPRQSKNEYNSWNNKNSNGKSTGKSGGGKTGDKSRTTQKNGKSGGQSGKSKPAQSGNGYKPTASKSKPTQKKTLRQVHKKK